MYQAVPQPFYQLPWNLIFLLFDIIRNFGNGFANHLDIVQTGFRYQETGSKLIKRKTVDMLLYMINTKQNIFYQRGRLSFRHTPYLFLLKKGIQV